MLIGSDTSENQAHILAEIECTFTKLGCSIHVNGTECRTFFNGDNFQGIEVSSEMQPGGGAEATFSPTKSIVTRMRKPLIASAYFQELVHPRDSILRASG